MPDIHNLWLFLIAAITLNLTPGPDMLYVISRSVGQGRMAGIVSALGGAVGCLIHVVAVTLGLASLMSAVPTAYETVRYAGAVYLAYLGVRTIMARPLRLDSRPIKEASIKVVFFQGVLTSVLNPKVALFFLAFLPQFVNHSGNIPAQIVFLGLLFNTSGTIVSVMVAVTASHVEKQLKARFKNSDIVRWLSGGILLGLGLRLAIHERR